MSFPKKAAFIITVISFFLLLALILITLKPNLKAALNNAQESELSQFTQGNPIPEVCSGIEFDNGVISNFEYLHQLAQLGYLQPNTIGRWLLNGCFDPRLMGSIKDDPVDIEARIKHGDPVDIATRLMDAYLSKEEIDLGVIREPEIYAQDQLTEYCEKYSYLLLSCESAGVFLQLRAYPELLTAVFGEALSHGCLRLSLTN